MLLHFIFIGKANLKLVMIGYFLNANCFHFLFISFQFLQLLKEFARVLLFMPKIAMPAAVHSSFLSFYDALIAVCCTAYGDALFVHLPAILAILDDVALAV